MSVITAVYSNRTHEEGSDSMVYVKLSNGEGLGSTAEFFNSQCRASKQDDFYGVPMEVCRAARRAFDDARIGDLKPYEGLEVDINEETLEVLDTRRVSRDPGAPAHQVF